MCERDEGRNMAKKIILQHTYTITRAYTDAYPHAHAHTYWQGRHTLFHQSNFGRDEMGDELRQEGWG